MLCYVHVLLQSDSITLRLCPDVFDWGYVHTVPDSETERRKSKGSVANCMTDRACVLTGNTSKQFLLHSRTLILVHTASVQHLLIITTFVNNYCRFCRTLLILLDMSFSLSLHFLPVLSLQTSVCSTQKFYPVFLGS